MGGIQINAGKTIANCSSIISATLVLEQIRKATNKGMIVGNDRFREEIEALTGRRVKEKRKAGWVAEAKDLILL
ncbi:MAG: hypothetical protein ACQETR_13845 [Thermodesulfobacteriota bacterium]